MVSPTSRSPLKMLIFLFQIFIIVFPWISQRMGDNKKMKFCFPDKSLDFPPTQMVQLRGSFYRQILRKMYLSFPHMEQKQTGKQLSHPRLREQAEDRSSTEIYWNNHVSRGFMTESPGAGECNVSVGSLPVWLTHTCVHQEPDTKLQTTATGFG